MKNTRQKRFLDSFHFKNINWIGKTGIRKLNNNKIVKIILSVIDTCEHYEKFHVKIIDTKNGMIDFQNFRFNDFLSTDSNCHHPSLKHHKKFEINEYVKWDWYIRIPSKSSVSLLVQEIENYIDLFDN